MGIKPWTLDRVGNREWPYEPDTPRRDGTAGWKVVGRDRSTSRVWQGQTGQEVPRQRGDGWYGNPISPGHSYPPPAEPWAAAGPGYDYPTGVHPAQSYPGYQPGYAPASPAPYQPQYPEPASTRYAEPVGAARPPYAPQAGWSPAARAAVERPREHPADPRLTEPDLDADEFDDEIERPPAAWQSVLAWTVACFVVPMVLYLIWAWTRSGAVAPGCVDLSGAQCVSPRVRALTNFAGAFPGIVTAITLSLPAAVGLRALYDAWRPATIGLGGAVIGSGVATILVSTLG